MITKKIFGNPIATYAVTKNVPETRELKYFSLETTKGTLRFTCNLTPKELVYGLGETMGRVNKRGGRYISFNTDTADHTDSNPSLYASHNLLLFPDRGFGVFFDTPGKVTFEIDYKNSGMVLVLCETENLTLYQMENDNIYALNREFLAAIGAAYLPPLWAFGYGQSRFGYKCEADFLEVADRYQEAGIPLDYICMDIDYMDRYIDFTVHPQRFPDLKAFVDTMKARGIRLVPIVDAGIKVEPGNPVYEEGVKNNHFCRNKDGGLFQAGVWPGMTHFPDFLRPETRKWFGEQYRFYTERGIEGFWNDMNEPAIFYSEYTKGPRKLGFVLDILFPKARKAKKERDLIRDYQSFYHQVDGKSVCHYDVHNLYGANMTRASSEGLETLMDKRFLLFSRSSYIGAGRYGGIWTGDNSSTWEHLKLNLRHMASVNMCGFLYSGADTGGFMGNCSRELLLRWLAVSVFTPLMRNHSSMGTRNQEAYQFGDPEAFRSIISLRYRLLPYLYSEYMKAALGNDLFIKPLSYLFPKDEKVRHIEDQLIVGCSIMMTPIIEEGKVERTVYVPEFMTMVHYDGKDFTCTPCQPGEMTIHAELNEVVFFIRENRLVPIGKPITNSREVDFENLQLLGDGRRYALYADDGTSRNCSLEKVIILEKNFSK